MTDARTNDRRADGRENLQHLDTAARPDLDDCMECGLWCDEVCPGGLPGCGTLVGRPGNILANGEWADRPTAGETDGVEVRNRYKSPAASAPEYVDKKAWDDAMYCRPYPKAERDRMEPEAADGVTDDCGADADPVCPTVSRVECGSFSATPTQAPVLTSDPMTLPSDGRSCRTNEDVRSEGGVPPCPPSRGSSCPPGWRTVIEQACVRQQANP